MNRKDKKVTKYAVVSARISDDELASIKQMMHKTNLSTSELMRKAIHLLGSTLQSC